VHVAPGAAFGAQAPFKQYAVEAHSASVTQTLGHVELPPLQRYGAHAGEPTEPDGATEQMPSAEAPCASVHTSHDVAQLLLQHTPSTQRPLWH
jgi:hypothetical protein